MTLYVVTSWCYSAYTIVAVFDDKALAKAFIGEDDDEDGDGMRIQEYELNPHADRIRAGLRTHIVVMDRSGHVIRHEESYDGESDTAKVEPRWEYTNGDVSEHCVYRFVAHIIAKTKKQAIKAANERRAMWIASGQPWPQDEPIPPKPKRGTSDMTTRLCSTLATTITKKENA